MVWKRLRKRIFPHSFFAGKRNFFFIRLPIKITRMPARKKRIPAKRIIRQVSSDAMFHREYPILIPGKALPHKKEQSITPRNVAISFFREEACIFLYHQFTFF